MDALEEAARAHRWRECSLALVSALVKLTRPDAVAFCRGTVAALAHRLHAHAVPPAPLAIGLAIPGPPRADEDAEPASVVAHRDIGHAFELLEQSEMFHADSPDRLIAAAAAVGRAIFACRMAAWRMDAARNVAFASSPAAASTGEMLWLDVAAALGETATSLTDPSSGMPDADRIRDRARWAANAGIP